MSFIYFNIRIHQKKLKLKYITSTYFKRLITKFIRVKV